MDSGVTGGPRGAGGEPPSGLEAVLCILAVTHDEQAWSRLTLLVGPDIKRLARHLCYDEHLADDILQDTLLRLVSSASSFIPAPDGLRREQVARRWVMGVAANTTLQWLRRERAQRTRADRAHQQARRPPEPPAEERLLRDEQAQVLARELSQLQPERSRAIALHHLSGLGYEDVARIMDIPIGTAKSLVRRGLATLRERLERNGLCWSLAVLAAELTQPGTSAAGTAGAASVATAGSGTGAASVSVSTVAISLVLATSAIIAAVGLVWHAHVPAGHSTQHQALPLAAAMPAAAERNGMLGTIALQRGWVSVGQAVPAATAWSGLAIAGHPTQCDIKTRWPDGSIRFAILTLHVDADGQGAVVATAAALPAAFTPRLPATRVVIVDQGATYTCDLPAEPSDDPWLTGPLACEWRRVLIPRGRDADHPLLRLIADCRCYRDGDARIDLTMENCQDRPDARMVDYQVSVAIAGVQALAPRTLHHGYLRRWRKVFQVGAEAGDASPDTASLISAGALPRFVANLPTRLMSVSGPACDLLGDGGVDRDDPPDQEDMHPELGPYPDWCARVVSHPAYRQQRLFLRMRADCAGSAPLHLRERDGHLPSIQRRSHLWLDARAQGYHDPDQPMGDLSPASVGGPLPDLEHRPALSCPAYLMGGDRFDLDELMAAATYSLLASHPDYGREGARGLVVSSGLAMAWAVRDLADAVACSPIGYPGREELRQAVLANLAWADAYAQGREGRYDEALPPLAAGTAFETVGPPDARGSRTIDVYPYHAAALAWSLAHAHQLGFPGGGVLQRRLLNLLDRVRAISAAMAVCQPVHLGLVFRDGHRWYALSQDELRSLNPEAIRMAEFRHWALADRLAATLSGRDALPPLTDIQLGQVCNAGWLLQTP